MQFRGLFLPCGIMVADAYRIHAKHEEMPLELQAPDEDVEEAVDLAEAGELGEAQPESETLSEEQAMEREAASITARKVGPMARIGAGYCPEGYVGGWDGLYLLEEECIQYCLNHTKCHAVSYCPQGEEACLWGGSCSRYEKPCPVDDLNTTGAVGNVSITFVKPAYKIVTFEDDYDVAVESKKSGERMVEFVRAQMADWRAAKVRRSAGVLPVMVEDPDTGDADPQENTLGPNGHGQRQENTLGANGHGQRQENTLGANGHGQRQENTLGANGHGQRQENTLGANGHGQRREGTLGANGHGQQRENTLGANGHGQRQESAAGADEEDSANFKVALVSMLGSYAPLTKAHLNAFLLTREELLNRGFDLVLGVMSMNPEGHVKAKLAQKGQTNVGFASRHALANCAFEDAGAQEWMFTEKGQTQHFWKLKNALKQAGDPVELQLFFMNGADDVFAGRKYNECGKTFHDGRKFVMVGRPGETDKVQEQLKKKGISGDDLDCLWIDNRNGYSSSMLRSSAQNGDWDTVWEISDRCVAAFMNGPWSDRYQGQFTTTTESPEENATDIEGGEDSEDLEEEEDVEEDADRDEVGGASFMETDPRAWSEESN